MKIKILLVEDNYGDARLLKHYLEKDSMPGITGESLTHVTSLMEGIEKLRKEEFDIVILDLGLPESKGIDTLRSFIKKVENIPIIVLTGLDDTETAITAIQEGAQDYLVKDEINGRSLKRSIRYAIERERMENALQESEQKFRTFTESAPVSIMILQDSKWKYLNPATEELTGYSENELLSMEFKDIIHPEDVDIIEEKFSTQDLETDGNGSAFEIRIQGRKGEEKWIDIRVESIEYDCQKAQLISAIDITERKKAEEVLKRYSNELEKEKEQLEDELNRLMEWIDETQSQQSQDDHLEFEDYVNVGGGIYLFPVEKIQIARNFFVKAADSGIPTLAVVREPPRRVKEALGRDIGIVWLTTNRVDGVVCINPSDIVNLSIVISEFYKRAPDGLVLFEGIEYLLSNVEFSRVLRLVQILNDKISMNDGAIFLVVDLETIEEKKRNQLERECLPMPEIENGLNKTTKLVEDSVSDVLEIRND